LPDLRVALDTNVFVSAIIPGFLALSKNILLRRQLKTIEVECSRLFKFLFGKEKLLNKKKTVEGITKVFEDRGVV
jgi:hypothetical protein